jgi:hypothetical protein
MYCMHIFLYSIRDNLRSSAAAKGGHAAAQWPCYWFGGWACWLGLLVAGCLLIQYVVVWPVLRPYE